MSRKRRQWGNVSIGEIFRVSEVPDSAGSDHNRQTNSLICPVLGQERGDANYATNAFNGFSSQTAGNLHVRYLFPDVEEQVLQRQNGDVVQYEIKDGAPVCDEDGSWVVKTVTPQSELNYAVYPDYKTGKLTKHYDVATTPLVDENEFEDLDAQARTDDPWTDPHYSNP